MTEPCPAKANWKIRLKCSSCGAPLHSNLSRQLGVCQECSRHEAQLNRQRRTIKAILSRKIATDNPIVTSTVLPNDLYAKLAAEAILKGVDRVIESGGRKKYRPLGKDHR